MKNKGELLPYYKCCLLLILLLMEQSVSGVDIVTAKLDFPELTELAFDTYDQQTWQPEIDSTLTLLPWAGFKIESRQHWIPTSKYLSNRFLVSPSRPRTGWTPEIHLTYYQKLRRTAHPINLGQIGLFFNPSGLIHTFTLGTFSLQAGEGLCLGAPETMGKKRSNLILPAYSLSHPALNGAAFQLRHKTLDAVFWFSQTERLAKMSDDKILHLYESLISDLPDQDKVQERSNGVLSVFKSGNYRLGAFYYHQDYSKEFADSTFEPVYAVLGIWTGWDGKPANLTTEVNFLQRKTAFAGKLDYKHNRFKQSLSYHYCPAAYFLSFSRTTQVFAQKTATQELSWDSIYNPWEKLALTVRVAACQDLSNVTDTRWKERLILAAKWSEKNWQSRLTWYRFRKDAVSAYDSVNSDLLPIQNRLKAQWQQKLTRQLDYGVTCQYQHYQDQKIKKNGFSLQYALLYHINKLESGLTFLAWSNQKSTYQPSESQTDDELLLQSDSDTAFRFKFSCQISPALKLSLQAYRPLQQPAKQSCQLNLQTAI